MSTYSQTAVLDALFSPQVWPPQVPFTLIPAGYDGWNRPRYRLQLGPITLEVAESVMSGVTASHGGPAVTVVAWTTLQGIKAVDAHSLLRHNFEDGGIPAFAENRSTGDIMVYAALPAWHGVELHGLRGQFFVAGTQVAITAATLRDRWSQNVIPQTTPTPDRARIPSGIQPVVNEQGVPAGGKDLLERLAPRMSQLNSVLNFVKNVASLFE